MDLVTAETAASRRSLLGALGAAGLAGTAAALAAGRPAGAAPADEPNAPTAADKELLAGAMRLELAARDLYEATLGTGVSGDAATLIGVMAENHEAYAQSIAGAAGLSADTRNDDVYDALVGSFETSDLAAFAEAAHGLEQSAIATHTDLLGRYEGIDGVELTASIVVVEARHAAVLADIAGLGDDLSAVLDNSAEPIDVTGGAA